MPLNKDVENILDPILKTFDDKLTSDVAGQIAGTRISGTAEMVSWGKTKAGVPIAYEGPPIQGAIDWAQGHSATLVKGIDEETKKRLAHTISQGIETKRGVPGLARDIRGTFSDMSKHRSELIARTETANALSQASLDTMEDMGIDGKEWVTAGDDRVSEECLGNEAEGVIPTKQPFSGGVDAPPQHPDCRCTIAPSRLPEKVPAKPEKPTGDDWAKTLSSKERESIEAWQRGGYDRIRDAQQSGVMDPRVKGVIKDLDKALAKSNPYEGNVYRGITNLDAKTFNAISKRKDFVWDALTSSAQTPEAASKFLAGKGQSIMFQIQNKTGVDITSASLKAFAGEKEILLQMGSKYRVVSQGMETYTWKQKSIKALKMVLEEI